MNEKEHKQYLKEFKAWAKEVISSKKNAQDFLMRAGIHDKAGNLSKVYAGSRHTLQ